MAHLLCAKFSRRWALGKRCCSGLGQYLLLLSVPVLGCSLTPRAIAVWEKLSQALAAPLKIQIVTWNHQQGMLFIQCPDYEMQKKYKGKSHPSSLAMKGRTSVREAIGKSWEGKLLNPLPLGECKLGSWLQDVRNWECRSVTWNGKDKQQTVWKDAMEKESWKIIFSLAYHQYESTHFRWHRETSTSWDWCWLQTSPLQFQIPKKTHCQISREKAYFTWYNPGFVWIRTETLPITLVLYVIFPWCFIMIRT